jgi:nicotinamide mononucleotide transporter
MIIGFLLWDKNKTNDEVKTETMGFNDYAILVIFTPLLICGVSLFVLDANSEQPFLDTLTTVIGIIAQIMLIFRFREQWVLWFILDVLCIVLWAIDGNWCLSMQYVFWTVNCIYGFYSWKK